MTTNYTPPPSSSRFSISDDDERLSLPSIGFEPSPLSIEPSAQAPTTTSNKSTIPAAIYNFVNSIVGAGIIGIPFALSQSGFVTGVLLLVLVSFITTYSVRQLIFLADISNTTSYEGLVKTVLNKPGSFAISFFMFELGFGAMVIYLSIIGDLLPSVFGFGGRLTAIAITSVILLPICLQGEINDLYVGRASEAIRRRTVCVEAKRVVIALANSL